MKRSQEIKPRKASDIYKKQNTLIHRAMHASGFPYAQNKDMWLPLIREQRAKSVGQSVINGLSDLTLAERHQLILYFQKKGMRLFSPSVPVNIRNWKKGDEDISYEFRKDGDPQVAMIYAMWEEMGYKQKTLNGLCFKLFKRDHPRWLTDKQVSHLVNVVKAKAKSKGTGVYYRA
jgi:hypothetical protein